MRFKAIALLVLGIALAAPPWAWSQGEYSSRRTGYQAYEASSGQYDDTEVLPRQRQSEFQRLGPGTVQGSASQSRARNRMFLADSHAGIPYYRFKKCEDCHAGAARNSHAEHAGITCRQCHGPEPVASVNHFFSRLNPARKHAYVCAKCHEGAGASFATFVVHQPAPLSEEAAKEFKALSWVSWGMSALLLGVFLLFVPHTLLWLLREYRERSRKGDRP
ncbi:cytochrome c3 family protein [Fundidesulfovibrio putealis]|uniref:hypothetical protein n=1 Tax=Fundidesulfovibrio putealis TaxID=270496 RepID=UPI0004253E33|nr:hypothetical protein [Fundidesulfovibrio putealis]